jgi:hypothetical protein
VAQQVLHRDVEEWMDPGTRVEVLSRFEHGWSRGFEIAEIVEGRYRVRRVSDGSVLPTAFDPDEVRRERKRSSWWY